MLLWQKEKIMFRWIKKYALPSQLRAAGVLGMNARNYDIIAANNSRRLYPLVDDKVITKGLARKIGINTPDLIGVIEVQNEVANFLNIVKYPLVVIFKINKLY